MAAVMADMAALCSWALACGCVVDMCLSCAGSPEGLRDDRLFRVLLRCEEMKMHIVHTVCPVEMPDVDPSLMQGFMGFDVNRLHDECM